MVFNSVLLVSAAKTSAEAWQTMACYGEHERIDGQQMVDLVLCFPLEQLGRLLLYLWTFLCVPPRQTFYYYYDDDNSNSSDGDDGEDGIGPSSSTAFRYVYYSQPTPDDDDDDSSSSSD